MTNHAGAWILAIDFGTSNTAAAIRSGGRNDVLELSRGSRTMPSGVILDTGNGPFVGETAERLRAIYPHAYEESPKRLVGMPPKIYDGRPILAEEFVAEIFREVRRVALDRKAGVKPAKVVLTHPSAWGGRQRQQLLRAAESAGFDRRTIVLVEEPIAAAHYHESVGQPIPVGGQVLVCDFGGGTLDLALVEQTDDGEFEVKDVEAIENLGGNNLDEALWDWTLAQIEAKHPEAITRLRSPQGRREEARLRDQVRKAKEELSFRPATDIPVLIGDDYDDAYRLTAEEYETLIRPLVEQAVALTRTLLDRNDTSKIVKFYLTGGSTLTPLVARALAQATGITPTRLEDPKTVVVDGALSAVAAVPAQPLEPEWEHFEFHSTLQLASVRWAFTGAALLWVSGILLFISLQVLASSGNGVPGVIIAFLSQAGAMAALFAHHLTRPLKEGRVVVYIYAGLVATSLMMALSVQNAALYVFAHAGLFGGCLVFVGVRLWITARQSISPYVQSLKAPSLWLIVSGALHILTLMSIIASEWFLLDWVWPAAIVGVGVGYSISAKKLKRELGPWPNRRFR
ncbi:Hsp70 family protein [Arthrobacter sp. W4I7]|uniref:Hsp70 family protein n=1 Tax=Arthrobacter sp. W4I7 TaxID=3042296 RepID=UPI0027855666|nr:Hsp70 family protein [Arthrobacter sp. W4I7]MDQ0693205.1 actin-like ATPase involved in cell morphogenesis [Arthrobacter sp. W4I7]